MDYYKVENINDIDLQMLLNDYIECFTKKKLIVQTTYFKLEQFEIRFNKRDIHHLLGFHKIQNKKVNATKTLQLILEGNLTSLCVIPKESSKNPQNLSVLFIDQYN
ncbi:PBECR4 domain-containing protein, partial [Staphylococcus condimenti]|uniref:PBECR4 domain-containing protein n=1 Tax=Staphylococcus condimenti TaxID=70255 RepID=UPI001F5C3C45